MMGVEFLPICDVLFNVVSLASYFCDVVFDVIATYTFFKSGHLVWFWLSLVSIALSLIVCQILSGRWMLSEERHKDISKRKLMVLALLHAAGGGMVWRYSLLFAPIQLEHVKREMRNLCVLRMIHGFAESMPLLIIQTYIACMSPASMEEINVISMALSLFNVCWALASFTKNIRSHNVHRLVLTWIGVIFQFMWRLGTITSRVLVLVLYSTVFTYWVFLVVVLHWITMMLWVLSRYATFKSERLTPANKVFLSFFVSYIHIFCYLNLEEQNTKLKIITFYTIMLVENVLLIALWTLGLREEQGGWEGSNRNRIYVAVFTSFFIGIFFMIIYYRFFHVRKLTATLSYSPNEETKSRKLQTSSQGSADDPAVTVFNCALNPALRKKKKLPSRSVPPPPPAGTGAGTPFWKEPLPSEERTAGDGLSYSRTTSVDDIRQKLQEKRDKQLLQLRRIEKDIAAGRMERPNQPLPVNQPIPVKKRQPMVFSSGGGGDSNWRQSMYGGEYGDWRQSMHGGEYGDWRQSMQGGEYGDAYLSEGTYLGVRQPYPDSENYSEQVPQGGLYDSGRYGANIPGAPDTPRGARFPQVDSNIPQVGEYPHPGGMYHQNISEAPLQGGGYPQGIPETPRGGGYHHQLNPNTPHGAGYPATVTETRYHSTPIQPPPVFPPRDGINHNLSPFQNSPTTFNNRLTGPDGHPGQDHHQPYHQRFSGMSRDRYSYKDSSGDQGDVDSGDDVSSRPGSCDRGQPALPPRLPLPLPRNRVVIGGYDHETPL